MEMHGAYAERECGTVVWTKYPVELIRGKGFKWTTRVHSTLHGQLLFVFLIGERKRNDHKILSAFSGVGMCVADERPKNSLTYMASFGVDTLGWTFTEIWSIKVEIVPCQRSVFRVILVELKYFIFIYSWASGRESGWSWKDSIQAAVFSGLESIQLLEKIQRKGRCTPFLTQCPYLLTPYLLLLLSPSLPTLG